MTKRPSVFTIPNPLPLPLPLPSLSLSLTRIIISLNQNIHQDKTYFPADLCPNLTCSLSDSQPRLIPWLERDVAIPINE
jgi:hypothetical protein